MRKHFKLFTLLAIGCTLSLASGLVGQNNAEDAPGNFAPPSFIPPPPPDFVPPPPPGMAPPPGPGQRPPARPPARPQAENQRPPWETQESPTPPAEQEPAPATDTAEVPATTPAGIPRDAIIGPGIVDPRDPRMQDTVGLIQIPDLGTNDILSMLEEFAGKPILRQQNLPTVRITFFSQGELTRGEAIRAIESLLAINGIALTKVGDQFLKAVPAATINTQAPIFWEGTTLGATPTQMIYEKVFELDFLTPNEASGIIHPLMSQGIPISVDKSGLLLVTDALVNLQRIERVLKTIDRPSRTRTEILFYDLKNNSAREVLRRLQQIQQGPLKRRLENNTTFDADERMNQLVVFTHPSNVELLDNLIQKMDVDVSPMTTTQVFSIRYAEAPDVVSIIDQVVTGQKQARDQQTGGQPTAAARQQAQANQAAAAVRAEAGNLQFSNFLTLVADERANNVVASGTPNDIRNLTGLIDQIDVLLAQVRIEAVIAEVSLEDNDASGISSLGFSYVSDDSGIVRTINPFTVGGIRMGGGDRPAMVFGPGDDFSMSALVEAVKIHSRSEILSAPTIVTTHNREARISVGERRPIITGTTFSGTTGASSSQVTYQNIGIELTVTPLIGSDNVIQLAIEQSIEDRGENVEIDNNVQPVIISRQASSFVSVGDGQLVILGGLQRNSKRDNKERFPILGHLPLLDKVFTRTTEQEERREIILFLRPRIIRTAGEANQLTREQIDVMESRDRMQGYLESGTFRIEEEPAEPEHRPQSGPPSRRSRP